MQTRGKTSMARQDIFKQASGNKSEHRKCANKFKQQIKQSNRSSNQTDQANKQIKQPNRSSKQADQASKQIKQTHKIATGSIYLALSKPSRHVEIKRTSGNKASVEYRANKIKQEYAIKQIKQTDKIDKRQRFLLFRTTICSAWFPA